MPTQTKTGPIQWGSYLLLSKWLPVRQQVRAVAVSLVFLLAACGDKSQQAGMPEGMKIPTSVMQVQPTTAEIISELPGRGEAVQDAELQARVTGIVPEINFRPASEVHAVPLLFT